LEKDSNILKRLYWTSFFMLLIAVSIVVKMTNLQLAGGDEYRKKAEAAMIKNFTIEPNRGSVFSSDGSLLAASVPEFEVRFDAVTVSEKVFSSDVKPLADSLSVFLRKPKTEILKKLQRARLSKNRYLLIAQHLSYSDYLQLKKFPIFKKGPYRGGLITEQQTIREHPLGNLAERTIGYDQINYQGNRVLLGIEGGYTDYLKGKQGQRLKQKIADNQWKPVNDNNEVEPQDGYDVVTTIDLTIQDIAHHALLEQLEKYEADHGTVVVMETATGDVKAIVNLGRSRSGRYSETINYAVGESHEPGSTFKVIAMTAALEDKVIDTSYVVDTENGVISFYGRKVRDSNHKGYGKISAAKAIEVSSNTGVVRIITDKYGDNPKKFTDRLATMGINQKLGLPLEGEGIPKIPSPNKKGWNGLSLPWMAFGYGVSMTPLQILTFYNGIANNGVSVKPRFVKEIKFWNKTVATIDTEIINPKLASDETLKKIRKILENTVERGTGKSLYNPDFSMAGKTGTCQTDYWKDEVSYISSFVGYFPAVNPKYSSIVVIHKPNKNIGYYGADVSGPIFKKIAQKVYTQSVNVSKINLNSKLNDSLKRDYNQYFLLSRNPLALMPDLTGLSGMDAVTLLENNGYKTRTIGSGKVVKQSVKPGDTLHVKNTILLELL